MAAPKPVIILHLDRDLRIIPVKFYSEDEATSGKLPMDKNTLTIDCHNISFNKTLTLEEGVIYNYTIRTGSYPQIIHESPFNATGGTITCDKFIDANGRIYYDGIPAIRLGV
ncbi:MAG: hypothetical protein ACXQS5_04870 [Candidatus Methanospirareceae archaeon]